MSKLLAPDILVIWNTVVRYLNQNIHAFKSYHFRRYNGNSRRKGRPRASTLQNSYFQLTAYASISRQTQRINKSLEDATLFVKEQGRGWQ